MKWIWEATNAGRPGLAGDLAKLFRHEEPKNPGILAANAPSASATLLAREVIQNSWDAAREQSSTQPSSPTFEICFRFHELSGSSKASLAEALDLSALADRVDEVDRRGIGLGPDDCLTRLHDAGSPLRVLQIEEKGATGMYGPWKQNKSHMYLALVSLGYTEKLSGAGGSFGYGKAGLINGSRIRSVVAYTCFNERDDDPGVTRRLLGMTFWGQHNIGDVNYTGIGSLSAGVEGDIRPFENDLADQVAASMGIEVRSPSEASQLGTVFLLIDPAAEPEDLVRAIERSWWPALQEQDFIVQVVTADGTVLHPRPKRDETLRTFVDAWDLARRTRSKRPDEWESDLTGFGSIPSVGRLALLADLSGWSYADQAAGADDDGVTHKSLIALTRGPRMVVEYLEVGHSQPYLRGVFIADRSIDDLLRRTEPKAHDSWQTRGQDGQVDKEAAEVADHVMKRIKATVNNHRTRLRPPVPPPDEVNLPFFNDVMRRVMSGMGSGVRQPVPEVRPISIRLDYEPLMARGGQVKLRGRAAFSLTEHFHGEFAAVELAVAYRFLEDDRVGEVVPLKFVTPGGLIETQPGVFRGRLERDQELEIDFFSEPYDPNWSGRLIVNGDLLPGSAAEQGAR